MPELIDRALEFITSLHPAVLLVAVLVAMVMETTALLGMLVPGEVVVLIAAATLHPGWSPVVALTTFVGTLLGQSAGYGLGRWFGPALRSSWLGRKIGVRRWEMAEEIVRGPGARAMISTRFVSVLHSLVPMIVGSLRMGYPRFLRLASVGAALWALMQTAFGVFLGQAGRLMGPRWAVPIYGTLALAIAVIVLVRAIRRQRRARHPDPSPAAPEPARDGPREVDAG